MHINVKPKLGPIISVEVDGNQSIEEVRQKVRQAMDWTSDKCFLLFAGTMLEDGKTLADFHIQDGFTIHVHEDRCGC